MPQCSASAAAKCAAGPGGHDTITRADAAFTYRVYRRHAVSLRYIWTHRDATLPGVGDATQVRRMAGIFYTLLGHERLGAVGWNAASPAWVCRRTDYDGEPMRHVKIAQLAVICGLAWPAAAIAEDAVKKGEVDARFKAMDANGDGRLSPAEHAAGAKKMFEVMDRSKDGKVTVVEMDVSYERITGRKATADDLPSAEKIRAVDANGDGIMTAAEHAAGSKMMFEKMDANKDGFLGRPEYEAGDARYLRSR